MSPIMTFVACRVCRSIWRQVRGRDSDGGGRDNGGRDNGDRDNGDMESGDKEGRYSVGVDRDTGDRFRQIH